VVVLGLLDGLAVNLRDGVARDAAAPRDERGRRREGGQGQCETDCLDHEEA
jgi:hypothetical protein